jgi:uncharacterized phiE125 gp8 family phage protein
MLNNTPLNQKANRAWNVTTPPAIEPVTLEEVKLWGRIDGSEEDDILDSLISTVRENMELYLGRALISQTLTMYLDYWPGNIVKLPRPPLISVTSISTLDESDAATIYDSDNYYLMTNAVPGEIIIKQGVEFPYNYDRDRGGFKIIWVAGYGALASNVPATIRDAIKQWVVDSFDNRVVSSDPPDSMRKKLMSFKVSNYVYSR